jgi:microcystin-dependent protein
MTQHFHLLQATNSAGTGANPANGVLSQALNVYNTAQNLVALNPASVSNTGGSQAHNNMMPYLVLNFCIALQGIFPSQS